MNLSDLPRDLMFKRFIEQFKKFSEPEVVFCALAIHKAYRQRAQSLIAELSDFNWVVLTDEPSDFLGKNTRAIKHEPTGPMAIDYINHLAATGNRRGAAAYHDKRFVLQEALKWARTAILLDADSHVKCRPLLSKFNPGIAVTPFVKKSVREHLETCGSWRLPIFEALAVELTGGTEILAQANWCHETPLAITKDGREQLFIEIWGKCAEFLQAREVFSGEGGVIGISAAISGWQINFQDLRPLEEVLVHESGGPKKDT